MNTIPRTLGLWTATSLVVGIMIGSGVFLLPATLAPYGAASLLGWGVTFCGALMLALVFAWLSRAIPANGGVYAYARAGFGDGAGLLVAWSYWICCWCSNAALAVAFAGSLSAVWPVAASTPLNSAICALSVLWFCALVNYAGARETGRMQVITTLLKLLPLVVFGLFGLAFINADSFQPFNPSNAPLTEVTTSVAALTLWAFLGLESATIASGNIRDPERNVPRATLMGMLIAGIVMMLACTVVIGLLPADILKNSSAPMADAATALWGPLAGIGVGIVATISCFGALNGNTLLQTQTPLAAAQDGLFPKIFGRVNAGGTPVFGLVLGTVLATALVIANSSSSLVTLFKFSILLSTAAALLPYAVCAAAWLRLNTSAGYGKKLIALGAFIYSLWALIGTGSESLIWGAGLLLAGVPVYLWQRYKS